MPFVKPKSAARLDWIGSNSIGRAAHCDGLLVRILPTYPTFLCKGVEFDTFTWTGDNNAGRKPQPYLGR